MVIYVLLKWKDLCAVFSSYDEALKYINNNEPDSTYHYRFTIIEQKIDDTGYYKELNDFKIGK